MDNLKSFGDKVLSTKYVTDFRSIVSSDSIISKIIFIILLVIVFVIFLKIGINILYFIMNSANTSGSPKLITGMVDATNALIFTQDPSVSSSKTIYRSNNAQNGIEFTWSVWIYVKDSSLSPGGSTYMHVFSKGNNMVDATTGLISPNNAPGLYINPSTNTITVFMNTFDNPNQSIEIGDIPLNKWVNVVIRCENTTLDIYVNGVITYSLLLTSPPKQNYGDVYVCMNGGFQGYVSNLWYYNYAMGTTGIQNLVNAGPNTTMTDSVSLKTTNYISSYWYFNPNTTIQNAPSSTTTTTTS